MGPGVDGDLVTLVVSALQCRWETDSARTNDEQRCLLVVLEEIVVETRRVRGWTVCSALGRE